MEQLTDREKLILGALVRYGKANLDDVNDTFADESELSDEDTDYDPDKIKVGGVFSDFIGEQEVLDVMKKLGINDD